MDFFCIVFEKVSFDSGTTLGCKEVGNLESFQKMLKHVHNFWNFSEIYQKLSPLCNPSFKLLFRSSPSHQAIYVNITNVFLTAQ